jgi:hypothetical protein
MRPTNGSMFPTATQRRQDPRGDNLVDKASGSILVFDFDSGDEGTDLEGIVGRATART